VPWQSTPLRTIMTLPDELHTVCVCVVAFFGRVCVWIFLMIFVSVRVCFPNTHNTHTQLTHIFKKLLFRAQVASVRLALSRKGLMILDGDETGDNHHHTHTHTQSSINPHSHHHHTHTHTIINHPHSPSAHSLSSHTHTHTHHNHEKIHNSHHHHTHTHTIINNPQLSSSHTHTHTQS